MPDVVIPHPTWKEIKPWLWRAIWLVVLVYLAYLVREIWLPLALALLIALVLDPIVDRLEQHGIRRLWGAILIFGSFLIVVVAVLILAVPEVVNQFQDLQQRIAKVVPSGTPEGIDSALKDEGASPMLRSIVRAIIGNAEASLNRSSSFVLDKLVAYASNMIWLVIVPIVAFYALRDLHVILAKAMLLVKPDRRELVQTAISEVTAVFGKYMRGLLLVCTLNGVATWVLLEILGVPNAFVLGAFAGILYSVPYLGAIITVLLISSVAFIAGGFQHMLLVLALNVVLHQIVFDQIVSPRLLGGFVGLHPILSIMALLAGNALLGLIGMILAVPVASCVQIGVLALVPRLRHDVTADVASSEAHLAAEQADSPKGGMAEAVDRITNKMPDRTRIPGRRTRDDDSGP